MDAASLARRIDHTVLGPTTTAGDAVAAVETARSLGTNACVPPAFLPDVTPTPVTLVTVVDFPHGQAGPEGKAAAAEAAWEDGADEVDVVTNVGRLRAGQRGAALAGIEEVVAAVPLEVKVIVEAGLLEDEGLRTVGELAREAGADYLKTSTGFAGGDATVEDVATLAEYLPVKASGGIADYETAVAMIEAGAERIGSSSAPAILAGAPE